MAAGEPVSIPFGKAAFIDDVAQYMRGKLVDQVIYELQQLANNYKMLEAQAAQKRQRLLGKLPEIQRALQVVDMLLAKQDSQETLVADFELADGVFATGSMQDVQSVNLWLGAGVMVEYPLEEAKQQLDGNLAACQANLRVTQEDLELLKESTTITEVNTARVFNWDVEERRKKNAAGGGS